MLKSDLSNRDHVTSLLENQPTTPSQNINDTRSTWRVIYHNVRRASNFDFDQSYVIFLMTY